MDKNKRNHKWHGYLFTLKLSERKHTHKRGNHIQKFIISIIFYLFCLYFVFRWVVLPVPFELARNGISNRLCYWRIFLWGLFCKPNCNESWPKVRAVSLESIPLHPYKCVLGRKSARNVFYRGFFILFSLPFEVFWPGIAIWKIIFDTNSYRHYLIFTCEHTNHNINNNNNKVDDSNTDKRRNVHIFILLFQHSNVLCGRVFFIDAISSWLVAND